MDYLTREELAGIGFSSVGEGTRVSRRAVFYDIRGSIGDAARIDDFAILTGHVEIGSRCHISPFCFLGGTGGRITLGNGAGMSTHVSLFTKSDDYQQAATGHRDKISGDILIGRDTILGAQCVVLPNTATGVCCSFGIGCVISGDYPDASRHISVGIKSIRIA